MTDDRYELVTFRGKTVDKMTRQALRKAERVLGYKLTIVQGSPSTAVKASANTHAGHGVVDLTDHDWQNKVQVLNEIGFDAFYRPARPGVWSAHVHAVLHGNEKLHPEAAAQVVDYHKKRNGLADHGPYEGPWVDNHAFKYNARSRGTKVENARALLKEALASSGDLVVTRRRPIKRALEILGKMEKVYK